MTLNGCSELRPHINLFPLMVRSQSELSPDTCNLSPSKGSTAALVHTMSPVTRGLEGEMLRPGADCGNEAQGLY